MESMQLYPERKKKKQNKTRRREKIGEKNVMNSIYEFGQYYQRNAIVWAIVRFVSSNISCSSDLELKLGLQNDEKRDCANMTREQCVACGFQNGIKLRRWCLPIFSPNSVRHSDFPVKDDTEEGFLGFEYMSSSEDEGKIKV